MLGLFSRVLGTPQPDWPDRVVVTGASFYNGPGPPELPRALSDFLDAGPPPLVGRHAENRPSLSDTDIFLADYARHDALSPRSAVIVHQGGAGTLHQAIRSDSPMLVVPHAHDQPDNAYRVERLGVARTLKPTEYRTDRVQRELALLLDEPAYREHAGRVSDLVQVEPGADGAAQAIEKLLG